MRALKTSWAWPQHSTERHGPFPLGQNSRAADMDPAWGCMSHACAHTHASLAARAGEASVALPVLFRCLLEYNEKVGVLLTTCSPEVYGLLKDTLPKRVTVQHLPLDNAVCIGMFMMKWRPQVGIIMVGKRGARAPRQWRQARRGESVHWGE
jgi:hypothetical protein